MNHEQLDTDRRLWCAVITQSLEDALSNAKALRNARRDARSWLTKPSRDFNEVCHLAGLDPEAVRERASKLIEEADAKAPAEPATLTFAGETLTLQQWSKRIGFATSVLQSRMRAGMPVHMVLSPTRLPSGTAALAARRRDAQPTPGVGRNFGKTHRDRRGSHAQHFSELEFSTP